MKSLKQEIKEDLPIALLITLSAYIAAYLIFNL